MTPLAPSAPESYQRFFSDRLRRVLRDRFRASKEQLDALESELRDDIIVPRPAQPSSIPVRDPDDRWVLASAISAGVDLLVTGDQDLLAVADQAPVPIVDPRGCWERLRRTREKTRTIRDSG